MMEYSLISKELTSKLSKNVKKVNILRNNFILVL